MKKIILITLLLLIGTVTNTYAQCSGNITYSSVPIRTTTALADALRIGDGGNGVITVCIDAQHTDGKCGGTNPTLYVKYDNGTTSGAFVAIWDMQTTATGTCYTFPVCNEYLYLKRTSCINNDGTNSTISWTYTNYQSGEYRDRCTNTVLPPSPSIDCEEATQICGTGTYPGNTNGTGVQELGCSSPNDGGCLLGGENNSAWYYFTAATDGTITFNITPTTNKDDYDFAVWGPDPNGCDDLGSPIRCNFALNKGVTGLNSTATWTEEDGGSVTGPGATNTGFSQQLTVTAGEVYYLLVDGYATAIDPNYTIAVGGTASLDCILLEIVDNDSIYVITQDIPEPQTEIAWFNLQGQLIDSNSTGFIIVKYDDGTISKVHKK